jgi:beta-aspartyl-dipeptidase (metallo-type)
MLTLIQNGEVYTPEPIGKQSILLSHDRILKIGSVDLHSIEAAGLECTVVNADGCIVLPGLVDPHQHLVGAGGENGFSSRLPEIPLERIITSGITTVVGLLGTDTVTREPSCLFAKVSQLVEEGLSVFMYTGGFEIPPNTLTQSVVDDLVMVEPIIGTGEIAISDSRWIDPQLPELAHVVSQTHLGGMMAKKAGVTHFHVGDGHRRLSILNDLLDSYEIPPECVYPTHITRSPQLMQEAVALTKRGCFVDMDAIEENIAECLQVYLNTGGSPEQVTVSSDSHTPGGSPEKFYRQFMSCLRIMPIEQVLRFFSTNAANVLKLSGKGRLEEGSDADVLIIQADDFEMMHLFARGRQVVKDGQPIVKSRQQQLVEEGTK